MLPGCLFVCLFMVLGETFLTWKSYFSGALSPLAEEQLTKQDLLLLEILRFLCICVTTVQIQTVSFGVSDIRRKLLMLTDGSVFDSAKPLHLHVVSVSFCLQQTHLCICTGFKLAYSCQLCILVFVLLCVPWEDIKPATFSVLKCAVSQKIKSWEV